MSPLPFLWLGTLSLFPLVAVASSASPVRCKDMIATIDQVVKQEGRDFCEVDQPCRDGMAMALTQIHRHFIGQKPGQSIPAIDIIRILKTETLLVKANCGNCYAGKGKRQQCQNGALAAASFIATALGINTSAPRSESLPCATPCTQGPLYAGYEQYNNCLRSCETRPPSQGCPSYCKESFDLKAFLKSLPQVK